MLKVEGVSHAIVLAKDSVTDSGTVKYLVGHYVASEQAPSITS